MNKKGNVTLNSTMKLNLHLNDDLNTAYFIQTLFMKIMILGVFERLPSGEKKRGDTSFSV